jgi:hypothetical protein
MRSHLDRRHAPDDLVGQVDLALRGRAERRPALGRRDHRGHHLGVGVAEDERAPGAHVVDVVVAVDVDDLGAVPALDEDRVAADRPHRAHRRVDAAGQALQRAGVELGRAGVGQRDRHQTLACSRSQALKSSVKYSSRIFLNSVEL